MTTPNPAYTRADIPIQRTDVPTVTGFRLSWGAIVAGLVMATALQIVLATLGGAIGLAAFDPNSGKALGIGAAAWAVLTVLISLFLGGGTTGRLAGVLSKKDAFLHGALLWSLSTLLTVWMVSRGVGALAGTAFSLAGNVAGSATSAVASGTVDVNRREVESQIADVREKADSTIAETREQAGQLAEDVASGASTGLWFALLGLGLSLAAAVMGARQTARE